MSKTLTWVGIIVASIVLAYLLFQLLGTVLAQRRVVTPTPTPPPATQTPSPTPPLLASPSPSPTLPPEAGTATPPPPPPTPAPITMHLSQGELEARLEKVLSQVKLPGEGAKVEVKVADDHLLVSGQGQMGSISVSTEGMEVRVEGMKASASGVVKMGALKMRVSGEGMLRVEAGKLKVEVLSLKVEALPLPLAKEELGERVNRILAGLDLGLPQSVKRVRIEGGELIVEGSNPP